MRTRITDSDKPLNLSQKKIREKIHAYLTAQQRSSAFIAHFTKGKGFCNGLAILAAYAQYLENLPDNKKPAQSCDDWAWFENTLKVLSSWDEKIDSLSGQNRLDIERLISHMEYFQNITNYSRYAQGQLHRFLRDTSRSHIKLEYTFAGLFTPEDLTKKIPVESGHHLIETSIIESLTRHPHRLILISCGNHTLSLFRTGMRISLYNSNNKFGRSVFDYADKTAWTNAIFQEYKYNLAEPSPLGFRIFTFDDKKAHYPQPHQLLQHLHHPFTTTSDRRLVDYSSLHIAARIGSSACVSHFLEQGAPVDSMLVKRRTPLYIAASRGYFHTARVLLDHQANININCGKYGYTPLICAAKAGRLRMLKLMLTRPSQNTFQNLTTALCHLRGRARRKSLIRILGKTQIAKMTADRDLTMAQLELFKLSESYNKSVYRLLSGLIPPAPPVSAVKAVTNADHLRFFQSALARQTQLLTEQAARLEQAMNQIAADDMGPRM